MVLSQPGGRRTDGWRVGLADGRTVPLSLDTANAQGKLAVNDVVLVHLADGKGKGARGPSFGSARRSRAWSIALENKTGRILAMTGGFSYPLSQLNRATQAVRQPGSTIKPLSYLAALGKGLQPNTLVSDSTITFPPIGGGRGNPNDYWTPKNYDGGGGGVMTLRSALENSRNLATVHLLQGGIEAKPDASLDRSVPARTGSPDLPRMRAVLSVRARRGAGAAGRSRRLLRRDRERRIAPDAAT